MVNNMFPLWHNDGRFSIKSPDKQQVAGIGGEQLLPEHAAQRRLLQRGHSGAVEKVSVCEHLAA